MENSQISVHLSTLDDHRDIYFYPPNFEKLGSYWFDLVWSVCPSARYHFKMLVKLENGLCWESENKWTCFFFFFFPLDLACQSYACFWIYSVLNIAPSHTHTLGWGRQCWQGLHQEQYAPPAWARILIFISPPFKVGRCVLFFPPGVCLSVTKYCPLCNL